LQLSRTTLNPKDLVISIPAVGNDLLNDFRIAVPRLPEREYRVFEVTLLSGQQHPVS